MNREHVSGNLSKVVSVRYVAELAGWPYKRMLAHLKARDREIHGMLLVKTGERGRTRYSLTMAALEQIHPEWFAQVSDVQRRLAALEAKVIEQEQVIDHLLKVHREQRDAIHTLVSRVKSLEDKRQAA